MKTALDTILSQPKYCDKINSQNGIGYNGIKDAMQEYADQQLSAYKEQLLAKLDAETERFEKMPHMMVERLIIKHIKTLIA